MATHRLSDPKCKSRSRSGKPLRIPHRASLARARPYPHTIPHDATTSLARTPEHQDSSRTGVSARAAPWARTRLVPPPSLSFVQVPRALSLRNEPRSPNPTIMQILYIPPTPLLLSSPPSLPPCGLACASLPVLCDRSPNALGAARPGGGGCIVHEPWCSRSASLVKWAKMVLPPPTPRCARGRFSRPATTTHHPARGGGKGGGLMCRSRIRASLGCCRPRCRFGGGVIVYLQSLYAARLVLLELERMMTTFERQGVCMCVLSMVQRVPSRGVHVMHAHPAAVQCDDDLGTLALVSGLKKACNDCSRFRLATARIGFSTS
ncbi:hypothetical protein BC628DRAFT_990902 [Trametes gibbosa]|nr:hypothetical protein BC628DRAFT_990902 [Trametes gibbosa]